MGTPVRKGAMGTLTPRRGPWVVGRPPGWAWPQAPRSAGSRGGRSGRATPSVGTAKLLTASWGGVLKPYLVRTSEGFAHLSLDTGVTALDADGKPLSEVGIATVTALPSATTYAFTGYAVDCSPEGATFSPAIRLIFSFTEEEWTALLGTVDGNTARLVVQGYNTATGAWDDCATSVDAAGWTLTAEVSHFSTCALTGAPAEATVTPEQTTVPQPTDTTGPGTGSAQPSGEPASLMFVWAGVVVLICAAIGGIYFLRKNR